MFKKITSILILFVMLFSLSACASGREKEFEKTAKQYFSQYENSYGKTQITYELKDNGSVAVRKVNIKDKTLKSELDAFYDALKTDFFAISASKSDSLMIATAAYKPADGVIGVEVYVKKTVSGSVEQSYHTFNTDMTDDLRSMSVVGARLRAKTHDGVDIDALRKSEGIQLVYTDSGVKATYPAGTVISEDKGTLSCEIPYSELYYTLPESLKTKTEKPVRAIDPSKKLVALTFDDGPHGVYTPALLDILEQNNSVATFFEVGNLVHNGAEALERANAMGCELASHTWSHANLQTASVDKIHDQIEKADAAFNETVGTVPTMLRPPYGAVDKELRENTDKLLIGWSVDTLDWQSRDAQKVIASVKREDDLDGDVILMHSLYKSTVDATEYLVPWLIENGYQLVTVSELVAYKYNDILEPGRYYSANYFNGEPKQ